MNPILIHKSDSTIFANVNKFLTFNLETDLDLTGWQAKFILGWVEKTIDDISAKSFEIVLGAQDTKQLRLGKQYGTIILTDSNGNIKTVTNTIPFEVTTAVVENEYQEIDLSIPESSGVDIKLKVGEKNITKLYYGDKAISKAYYGDKLVFQAGDGGRFVTSILFDGASWIDTGINKQSCTIECTVKLESTDYRQFLCGWSHIGGYYIAVDTSNRFELGSSAIVTGSNATELSNVVAEHTKTEMILTVNGNYAKRTKQVQTEPDKNYWLGNINSTSYSAPIKGQVRGHKFKNADGVLIQDLRPYVDENGTACFKDIVTGKLFYNQGTGKLEYTE